MDRLVQTTQELLNFRLNAAQRHAFEVYARELLDWNAHTNLTAITDPADIEMRHFVDSLSCLSVINPRQGALRVIDVGTGAGFPGIPIKIACPAIDLVLVEATVKKVRFLEHIAEQLGLEHVSIIHARAESLGQIADHREQYDWVLARAVAALPILAEYLLPLCRIGGHCLPQKGETAHQEVIEAQHAINLLGGKVIQLTPVELPTVVDTRYLVDIEKVASTPPKYPRRPGMPSKRPLG
ncbi:MAG: 16S rRNA (guanine(527)-N(7))-methyltransferase RsmG [Anaerolineae bacterium]|nr:16S rRNA (guanine(527)-N(7))-methyltransferase RsmG [Anaerolineae bacterium]